MRTVRGTIDRYRPERVGSDLAGAFARKRRRSGEELVGGGAQRVQVGQVQILDDKGSPLPPGVPGEVDVDTYASLVPLLEDFNPADLELVHAVYLGGGNVPGRVRTFVDHMVETLGSSDVFEPAR